MTKNQQDMMVKNQKSNPTNDNTSKTYQIELAS